MTAALCRYVQQAPRGTRVAAAYFGHVNVQNTERYAPHERDPGSKAYGETERGLMCVPRAPVAPPACDHLLRNRRTPIANPPRPKIQFAP